jgi:hypothetical protein
MTDKSIIQQQLRQVYLISDAILRANSNANLCLRSWHRNVTTARRAIRTKLFAKIEYLSPS